MSEYPFSERLPRTPRQEHQFYLLPFSFKHPVTGKDVNKDVEAWYELPPGTKCRQAVKIGRKRSKKVKDT